MAALRADISIANTRLSEVEEERDKYHNKLLSAEAHVDRLRGVSAQSQRETPVGPLKSAVKEETKDVIMNVTTPEKVCSIHICHLSIHSPSRTDEGRVAYKRLLTTYHF